MFINKKIALAGALALVFAGSAQAAIQELSCSSPGVRSITLVETNNDDWDSVGGIGPITEGAETFIGKAGTHTNVKAQFKLHPSVPLATVKVKINNGKVTAGVNALAVTGGGVTYTLTGSLPNFSAAETAATGFTHSGNQNIIFAIGGGTTNAGVKGSIVISATCPGAATVSAVPASNPWTLAALGGVLAIAGGSAAAARRRKAQNPSA